ncbi:MAG: dihydroneopterin aldolase [Kiritimatiellae bacterium]|nr:dihydroneopterin aldolase [Kiritimatiellia bacterium]
MKLELHGLEACCIIGDTPEERGVEQRLLVDMTLDIDDCAAVSDDLSDTVDYAALAHAARTALAAAKCRLIERAAKTVFDACAADPRVKAAEVRVTKSGRVPGLSSAAAVYAGRTRGGREGA